MKNVVDEILRVTNKKRGSLVPMLSRIKSKHDLKSIEQAACFYIKRHRLKINVSSVIDDVTRAKISPISPAHMPTVREVERKRQATKPLPVFPKISWVGPAVYGVAALLHSLYGHLFLFENALRIRINDTMEKAYPNWWETRLRTALPAIYQYAQEKAAEQVKLKMIGPSVAPRPIECVTLGQLEDIVKKNQAQFIPSAFPSLEFFTGHMVIIKRVRNGVAHMSPGLKPRDIKHAKNEINILLDHFAA